MVYPRRYGSRNYGGGGFGSSLMGGVEAALYTIAAARDDERRQKLEDERLKLSQEQVAIQRENLRQGNVKSFADDLVSNPTLQNLIINSIFDKDQTTVSLFNGDVEKFNKFVDNNPRAMESIMNLISETDLKGRNPPGVIYNLERVPPRQSNDMSMSGGYIAQLSDDTSGLGPGGSFLVSTNNLDGTTGAITEDGSNADTAKVKTWSAEEAMRRIEHAVRSAHNKSAKGYDFSLVQLTKKLNAATLDQMRSARQLDLTEEEAFRDRDNINKRFAELTDFVTNSMPSIEANKAEKEKLTDLMALDVFESEVSYYLQNAFDHTEVAEILDSIAGSPDDISKYNLLKNVANQINEAMTAPGALGLTIDIPQLNSANIKERNPIIKGAPLPETAQEALEFAKKSGSNQIVALDENGKPVIKLEEDSEFESMLSLIGVDSLDDLEEWAINNGADVAALGLMLVPGVGWLSAGYRTKKAIEGLKALVKKTGKGSWDQFRKLWTKKVENPLNTVNRQFPDLAEAAAKNIGKPGYEAFDKSLTGMRKFSLSRASFSTGALTFAGSKIAGVFGDDETTKLPQRIQYFNTLLADRSKELNFDRMQDDRERFNALVKSLKDKPNLKVIEETRQLMQEKNLTSMENIRKATEDKILKDEELMFTLAVTAAMVPDGHPLQQQAADRYLNLGGTGDSFLSPGDQARVQAEQIKAESRKKSDEYNRKTEELKAKLKADEKLQERYQITYDTNRNYYNEARSSLLDEDEPNIGKFNENFRKYTTAFWNNNRKELRDAYRVNEEEALEAYAGIRDMVAKRLRIAANTRSKEDMSILDSFMALFKPGAAETIPLGDLTEETLVALEQDGGVITKFGFKNEDGLVSDLQLSESQVRELFGKSYFQAINAAVLANSK